MLQVIKSKVSVSNERVSRLHATRRIEDEAANDAGSTSAPTTNPASARNRRLDFRSVFQPGKNQGVAAARVEPTHSRAKILLQHAQIELLLVLSHPGALAAA